MRDRQTDGRLSADRRSDSSSVEDEDLSTHSRLTARDLVEGTAELRSRYGRTGPRRLAERWWLAIGAAAVLVVFGIWAGWAGWIPTGSTPALTSTSGAANVMGEHQLQLTFSVETKPGNTVACALEALDANFTIVGWKVVVYRVAQHDTSRTVEIRTTHRSATGDIDQCWLPTHHSSSAG